MSKGQERMKVRPPVPESRIKNFFKEIKSAIPVSI